MMKFSELTGCPFCGFNIYYTTSYVKGTVEHYRRFDNKDVDNSSMYDKLIHTFNKQIRCAYCDKYLGNAETDTVGKEAERAFLESH